MGFALFSGKILPQNNKDATFWAWLGHHFDGGGC